MCSGAWAYRPCGELTVRDGADGGAPTCLELGKVGPECPSLLPFSIVPLPDRHLGDRGGSAKWGTAVAR